MNKNLKKMTFLIPAYKGLKWLELNKNFWKEIVKYVDVILVEDSLDYEMKQFCKDNNISYFAKENGNWGSVINFALEHRIIKTEWMAIVDVDDTVNIDEMKILLEKLDSNIDVVFSSSNNVDFVTKTKISTTTGKWVHSTWLKTSEFYKMTKLPEKAFYTDTFFSAYVLGLKNNKEIFELSPYNYFQNIPGQSIAGLKTAEQLASKMTSLKVSEKMFPHFVKENNLLPSKEMMRSRIFCVARAVREIYNKSNSKDDLKLLKKIYKENYNGIKVAFSEKLLWSKFYRLFSLKGSKKSEVKK